MIQSAATSGEESVEAVLHHELAQGDAVLRSAAPIMRHLLSGARHAIFADEIVARVRGGVDDIARQVLDAVAAATRPAEHAAHDRATLDVLTEALILVPGLLGHVHALAVEWQLAERFQARRAIDPVVPPLLEALLASEDATTSGLAMNQLAAQARFAQTQRRMQVPLAELPADLLHGVLQTMRGIVQVEADAALAEKAIRSGYDEGRTRLGLLARLVTGMGGGVVAALSLQHAGAAIFATALGIASGQDRDLVILSTTEGQSLRLALALRAAGLKKSAIEEQLLALHGDASLPTEWDRLTADEAANLLVAGEPEP